MNPLSDLLGKLTGGAAAGGTGQNLATSVLELLGNRQGGLGGLVETFQQKGLGNIISSWIGTGANEPISPEQVRQAFGEEEIRAFARKSGIAPEAADSQLAQLLPQVVDKLTPDGRIPEGDLMSKGMGMLKGLFGAVRKAGS